MPETFSDIHLEAVHVPERHDPDPSNKDQPLIDLPGMVDIYLVIDGGRLLLNQFKAGQVFAAIERGKHSGESADKPVSKKHS